MEIKLVWVFSSTHFSNITALQDQQRRRTMYGPYMNARFPWSALTYIPQKFYGMKEENPDSIDLGWFANKAVAGYIFRKTNVKW